MNVNFISSDAGFSIKRGTEPARPFYIRPLRASLGSETKVWSLIWADGHIENFDADADTMQKDGSPVTGTTEQIIAELAEVFFLTDGSSDEDINTLIDLKIADVVGMAPEDLNTLYEITQDLSNYASKSSTSEQIFAGRIKSINDRIYASKDYAGSVQLFAENYHPQGVVYIGAYVEVVGFDFAVAGSEYSIEEYRNMVALTAYQSDWNFIVDASKGFTFYTNSQPDPANILADFQNDGAWFTTRIYSSADKIYVSKDYIGSTKMEAENYHAEGYVYMGIYADGASIELVAYGSDNAVPERAGKSMMWAYTDMIFHQFSNTGNFSFNFEDVPQKVVISRDDARFGMDLYSWKGGADQMAYGGSWTSHANSAAYVVVYAEDGAEGSYGEWRIFGSAWDAEPEKQKRTEFGFWAEGGVNFIKEDAADTGFKFQFTDNATEFHIEDGEVGAHTHYIWLWGLATNGTGYGISAPLAGFTNYASYIETEQGGFELGTAATTNIIYPNLAGKNFFKSYDGNGLILEFYPKSGGGNGVFRLVWDDYVASSPKEFSIGPQGFGIWHDTPDYITAGVENYDADGAAGLYAYSDDGGLEITAHCTTWAGFGPEQAGWENINSYGGQGLRIAQRYKHPIEFIMGQMEDGGAAFYKALEITEDGGPPRVQANIDVFLQGTEADNPMYLNIAHDANGSNTGIYISAGSGDGFEIALFAPDSIYTYYQNKVNFADYGAGMVFETFENGNAYVFAVGGSAETSTNISLAISRTGVKPKVADYANDAAAASGGIPVGEMYHNAGALRVRLS
jgi:hypothetical protein